MPLALVNGQDLLETRFQTTVVYCTVGKRFFFSASQGCRGSAPGPTPGSLTRSAPGSSSGSTRRSPLGPPLGPSPGPPLGPPLGPSLGPPLGPPLTSMCGSKQRVNCHRNLFEFERIELRAFELSKLLLSCHFISIMHSKAAAVLSALSPEADVFQNSANCA